MAQDGRPNVLFLYPDQHRHDWLGGLAQGVNTPNIDALAGRGMRFTNAVCPSPLCAPSRACLAAGVEYDRCPAPSNGVDLPLDVVTMYRLLRDSGYHVMGCGKFDLAKKLCDWDVDGTRRLDEWGFSAGIDSEGKWDGVSSGRQKPRGPYLAYLERRGLREAYLADMDARRGNKTASFATTLDDEAYGDNWVGRNALALLEAAPADKPWFLQVNFPGPHDPWDITKSMAASVAGREMRPAWGHTRKEPGEIAGVRRNYTAMVENIDRWLGVLEDGLRERGQWDNTLIVYSSDHGEMLGDLNGWAKSKPYQPAIGVPLMVAGPGVAAGGVCVEPATNLDLTATFLETAGLSVPADMDSRPLGDLLAGRTERHREFVRVGLKDWRVVFDGRYKFVRGFGDEAEMLFDLQADPTEQENLIDRPGLAEARSRLAAAMNS